MESTQKFSKYSSNLVIEGSINVAPKKEMFFIYHFPKEYVGRSIQNAVNMKLYINSNILRAVYLYIYTTGCLCL